MSTETFNQISPKPDCVKDTVFNVVENGCKVEVCADFAFSEDTGVPSKVDAVVAFASWLSERIHTKPVLQKNNDISLRWDPESIENSTFQIRFIVENPSREFLEEVRSKQVINFFES